jgi:hypothetical protein
VLVIDSGHPLRQQLHAFASTVVDDTLVLGVDPELSEEHMKHEEERERLRTASRFPLADFSHVELASYTKLADVCE